MAEKIPAISICIPTYNGAKYIAQTIQSVLKQTFVNFEIIVSDDGSTDTTLEIVGSFDDPRIVRVDRLSKVGAVANWNNSVINARASLIKLVCQDDLLYPRCLEVEVETMSNPENQDVSFCFHRRDLVTPNSHKLKANRVGNLHLKKYSKAEILTKIVRSGGNPIGEPMAVTMRKLSLSAAGQFRGDFVIDLDMWARLLDQGKALFIAKHLSAFRISETSWTSSLTKSQFKTIRAFHLQLTKSNPEVVKQSDLRLGLANNILRTFMRQFASKVILTIDKFFGATR